MNDLSNHIALDQKYYSIGETRHLPSLMSVGMLFSHVEPCLRLSFSLLHC